jgi:hypothetical protein
MNMHGLAVPDLSPSEVSVPSSWAFVRRSQSARTLLPRSERRGRPSTVRQGEARR